MNKGETKLNKKQKVLEDRNNKGSIWKGSEAEKNGNLLI